MVEAGVEFVRVIDKAPFIEAMVPVCEQFVTTDALRDLVERIQATEQGARCRPVTFHARGRLFLGHTTSGTQMRRSSMIGVARHGRAGAALVLMTAVVALHVFYRFVLNGAVVWTLPASVMIMGRFIFLGAVVGIREGHHLSCDVLLHVLADRVVQLLHAVSDLLELRSAAA